MVLISSPILRSKAGPSSLHIVVIAQPFIFSFVSELLPNFDLYVL